MSVGDGVDVIMKPKSNVEYFWHTTPVHSHNANLNWEKKQATRHIWYPNGFAL
jgi:hypothetical protein